eukprot:2062463-Amphidinium_carterae.2
MADAPTAPHLPMCVCMMGLIAQDTLTVREKWRPIPVVVPETELTPHLTHIHRVNQTCQHLQDAAQPPHSDLGSPLILAGGFWPFESLVQEIITCDDARYAALLLQIQHRAEEERKASAQLGAREWRARASSAVVKQGARAAHRWWRRAACSKPWNKPLRHGRSYGCRILGKLLILVVQICYRPHPQSQISTAVRSMAKNILQSGWS